MEQRRLMLDGPDEMTFKLIEEELRAMGIDPDYLDTLETDEEVDAYLQSLNIK